MLSCLSYDIPIDKLDLCLANYGSFTSALPNLRQVYISRLTEANWREKNPGVWVFFRPQNDCLDSTSRNHCSRKLSLWIWKSENIIFRTYSESSQTGCIKNLSVFPISSRYESDKLFPELKLIGTSLHVSNQYHGVWS